MFFTGVGDVVEEIRTENIYYICDCDYSNRSTYVGILLKEQNRHIYEHNINQPGQPRSIINNGEYLIVRKGRRLKP